MQNDSGQPFPYQPKRLSQIPGFECKTEALHLLDEHVLEDMLGQLERIPQEYCYPVQIAFYEALMQCDVLLPIPAEADLRQGLPLLSLENGKGEKGLPVFSTPDNLSLWQEEALDYLAVPFITLCGYALEARMDYMILNLAGPVGCEISFHDFSYLAEGLLPPPSTEAVDTSGHKPGEVMIAQHTPMRLSVCQAVPELLMTRLMHVFKHYQGFIEQVYLFDIAFNEGPMQPALGVRMPEALAFQWEEALWPNLQAVLHEMLEKHCVMNVFLLNQAGSLETHLKSLTAPIYRH